MTEPVSGTVRITEIFQSLQGESRTVGWPTVFVRLTGCPLRCQYCDTAYAFHGGRRMTIDQVLDDVRAFPARHVTVTGGEPLAQPGVYPLMSALCDAGLQVSLETSGALDIGRVDPRVSRVVDLKTPGSGEVDRNRYANAQLLTPNDQVKFVICDRRDFDWAMTKCDELTLWDRAEVWFSPSASELPPRRLADWLLEAGARARLQVQLHKVLWGDEPGR